MSTQKITHITIHTDGSCLPNPGFGAYAAIIQHWNKDQVVSSEEVSGTKSSTTTNNKMEMYAAYRSLRHVRNTLKNNLSLPITVFSDNKYVIEGMKSWLEVWKANGWRTASKSSVKNDKAWQQLDEVSTGLN